jgi:hypothetical protein
LRVIPYTPRVTSEEAGLKGIIEVRAARNDRIAGMTKNSEATQIIQPIGHAMKFGSKAGIGTTRSRTSPSRKKTM